jgi:hypothetical protein
MNLDIFIIWVIIIVMQPTVAARKGGSSDVKRAKLVLAVSAVMLAIMVAYAAPALAAPDRDNHRFVSHDVEQEADSGDVDQSFEVSGGGDNSNQTASIQGVANTGNAQNFIGVSDGFGGDDFFDDRFFFCDDEDFDGFCDGDRFFDNGFFFGDFDGDGFDDGFEFEDVEASIELSPEQVVSSDQVIDQAATAFG